MRRATRCTDRAPKLRAEPEPLTRDVDVDFDTELAREMKQGVDRRMTSPDATVQSRAAAYQVASQERAARAGAPFGIA